MSRGGGEATSVGEARLGGQGRKGKPLPAVLLLLLLLRGGPILACPYTIREIGFAPLKREPYRLCLVVGGLRGAEGRVARIFTAVASKALKDSNVVPELVDTSTQKGRSHPALRLAPGLRLPALVMVSPWGTALPLAQSVPAAEGAIRRAVERVVSSPAREEIKRHVIRDWCVVLFVEGSEGQGNKRALREVEDACRRIKGQVTEMGVVVKRGPYVLRLRPGDFGRERVLLWSLGLLGRAGRSPVAVLLFGRGQQIGPTFEGAGIKSASLLKIFRLLGGNCSCTTDLKWLSGRRVPLKWDYATRQMACEALGFDPDSPEVAASLATVGINVDNPDACQRALVNYTEAPIDEMLGNEDEAPTVSLADVASGGTKEAEGAKREKKAVPEEGASKRPDERAEQAERRRMSPKEEALLGYREFVVDQGGVREIGEEERARPASARSALPPLVAMPTPSPPQRQVFPAPEEGGKAIAEGKGRQATSAARAPGLPPSPTAVEAMRARRAASTMGRTATKAVLLAFLLVLVASGIAGLALILLQKRRREAL